MQPSIVEPLVIRSFGGPMNPAGMTRKRASVLLFGGALAGALRLPARAQAPAVLRIAVSPIEPAAEVYYAKDMGFLAKAGLDADIQSMQGSSLIVSAIVSNSADLGFDTLDGLAAQHQKGIPLVVIAPTHDYLSPGSLQTQALVVPANSPIQQPRDLNGKTIAVSTLHSLADIGARVLIDKNGGDSSTVKFVEVPFPHRCGVGRGAVHQRRQEDESRPSLRLRWNLQALRRRRMGRDPAMGKRSPRSCEAVCRGYPRHRRVGE
jgi:ABC-type nitrate/sulfonate/bicarbonate transport system substrate-binding protein